MNELKTLINYSNPIDIYKYTVNERLLALHLINV